MEPGVKTDLKLLLECLKFQMNNPKAQKEALITVASICTAGDAGKEALLECGGVKFIMDLVTSTDHPDLKQAAMYALACAVDANIFCQKQFSSMALFCFLHAELVRSETTTELKRMAVYLISCLVSNNNICQMLVRKSNCLQTMLQLFKQLSERMEGRKVFDTNPVDCNDEQFTLWSSILLTICVSVNNPQNSENQGLCMSVMPTVLKILNMSVCASVIRPLSSLIGLTVSNNAPNQERFRLIGGLECIVSALKKLTTDINRQNSADSVALAIHVAGTLNSCIADNLTSKKCLSELGAVRLLLVLLSYEFLDVQSRLQLIVSLVHCTDSCVENQLQLVDNGGLPVVVKYMSEIHDEEFSKAATYLLRVCLQENDGPNEEINPARLSDDEIKTQVLNSENQLSHFNDCLTKLTVILDKMDSTEKHQHRKIKSPKAMTVVRKVVGEPRKVVVEPHETEPVDAEVMREDDLEEIHKEMHTKGKLSSETSVSGKKDLSNKHASNTDTGYSEEKCADENTCDDSLRNRTVSKFNPEIISNGVSVVDKAVQSDFRDADVVKSSVHPDSDKSVQCNEDAHTDEVREINCAQVMSDGQSVKHVMTARNTVRKGKFNSAVFKKSVTQENEVVPDFRRPIQSSTPKFWKNPDNIKRSQRNVKRVAPKCVSIDSDTEDEVAENGRASQRNCPSGIKERCASGSQTMCARSLNDSRATSNHPSGIKEKCTSDRLAMSVRSARNCKAALEKTLTQYDTPRHNSTVSSQKSLSFPTPKPPSSDVLSVMKTHTVVSRKRRLQPTSSSKTHTHNNSTHGLPSYTLPVGQKHRKIFVAKWMSASKVQSHFLLTPPKQDYKRKKNGTMTRAEEKFFMENCPGCSVNVGRSLNSRNYKSWIERSSATCKKHKQIRQIERGFTRGRHQRDIPETPVKPTKKSLCAGGVFSAETPMKQIKKSLCRDSVFSAETPVKPLKKSLWANDVSKRKCEFPYISVIPRKRRLTNLPPSSVYDFTSSESE